jgi:hypothetical protein
MNIDFRRINAMVKLRKYRCQLEDDERYILHGFIVKHNVLSKANAFIAD